MKRIFTAIIDWFRDIKDTTDHSYLIDDAYMELDMDEKMGRGNE